MLSYFILIIIAGSKYKFDSLMEDKKKQSFEIICPTFTTRFKFDNYFSIFLDLL
jgi:hypothetical protein